MKKIICFIAVSIIYSSCNQTPSKTDTSQIVSDTLSHEEFPASKLDAVEELSNIKDEEKK